MCPYGSSHQQRRFRTYLSLWDNSRLHQPLHPNTKGPGSNCRVHKRELLRRCELKFNGENVKLSSSDQRGERSDRWRTPELQRSIDYSHVNHKQFWYWFIAMRKKHKSFWFQRCEYSLVSFLSDKNDQRNYRRFIDQTDWSTITIIISCIVSCHFSLMKLKNFQMIFKPFYQLTALYLYTRIYWILLFHFITLNLMFLSR